MAPLGGDLSTLGFHKDVVVLVTESTAHLASESHHMDGACVVKVLLTSRELQVCKGTSHCIHINSANEKKQEVRFNNFHNSRFKR